MTFLARGGLFLLLLWPGLAGAAGPEARYIPPREYADVVKREIDRATRSVTVCLYLFTLSDRKGSPTRNLAEALSSARARGTRVEVVLNGWVQPGGSEGFRTLPTKNRTTYDFLKQRGVDVSLSGGTAPTHSKIVVVDEGTVIVGSTNWSEAALEDNAEANVLIRDPAVARKALEDISRIPRLTPPEEHIAARVPASFLTNPKQLGDMVTKSSDGSFDVYLYLLMASEGKPVLTLSYAALAESLGLQEWPRQKLRAKVNDTLRYLEHDFGLIRSTTTYGRDATVEILPAPGETVGLPAEYWTWGWCRKLSLPGKVMYLLNRRYSAISPWKPQWSWAEKDIAAQNHVSTNFVSKGTLELRRAGLVSVEYDFVGSGPFKSRRPNIYTPLPLYDPEDLDRAWKSLAEQYGEDKLARARKCVDLVFADSDAEAVERFILLEERYGRDKVRRAYDLIARRRPDNPKRGVGYFLNTIKKMK